MNHPAFCRQCGNSLQKGDSFCGNCGAATLPPAPQAEQAIPRREAASASPVSAQGNRRLKWIFGMSFLAVVVLIGVGALAFVKLGISFGSVSPNSTPDPAFDLPLQALENRTDAPIMLPAKLPGELKNVALDESLEGDSYGILFKTTPPEDLVEPFMRYNTVATLTVVPKAKVQPNQLFEATSSESVKLPDGTEAGLRYMKPVGEVVNYGAYWEGTFDKGGYTYTLSNYLGKGGKEISEQVLSTMVKVE